MVKVEYIIETKHYKKGDVVTCSREEAEEMITAGRVRYVYPDEQKKEIAKFYRDKHVIETLGINKVKSNTHDNTAGLGIDPDNFDRIRAEQDPEYTEKIALIRDYLEDPNLFKLITEEELDKKIVGEVASRKVIFLSACGRLVKNCQTASYNLLVNDDAGTGKDYVTNKTLAIIPKESCVHKTRISPAVFTYWHCKDREPDWTWDGKVFYPEDISEAVLNSDVFKVMCSSGSTATIVVRQKAVDLEIVGKPVMITTTATAIPSPELTRRFSILNLDSSENQTREIMKRHSWYKKQGIIPEYNQDLIEAQKLLERVDVKISFADLIDKYFPMKNVIMRTLYPRFLDYISASTALHQFQRKKEDGFILADGQDYDIARECFLKLCSNKYMIPMTINQKKILEIFEREPFLKGSASNLHSTKMSFLSLPALLTNLGILTSYGILQTIIEKDSWNRDIEIYSIAQSYKPNEKIDIPTFEELCRNALLPLKPILPLTPLTPLTPQTNQVGSKDIKGIKVQNDNTIPNNSANYKPKVVGSMQV